MTTSGEWAERLEGYIPDDGPRPLRKFIVTYTIDGAIDFEAETADEAMRKFWKLDQRELGEIGELLVHTDPLEVKKAERGCVDGSREAVADGRR